MSEIKKEQEPNKENEHSRISPTAYGVAYGRTLSDIPFSVEIFDEMMQIGAKTGIEYLDGIKKILPPESIPMFEARFKLTDKILDESGIDQVLEIASGFSQRGFIYAQNPSIRYAELDLPGVISEKKNIAARLVASGKIPEETNLHFNEGNALEIADLSHATEFFADKPIAILNEGLLRYLNFEERATYAKNIYQLLDKFGGVWITPDNCVEFGGEKTKEKMKDSDEKVKKITGVDVEKYHFKDEQEAQIFFENLGFTVKRRSFMEVFDEHENADFGIRSGNTG